MLVKGATGILLRCKLMCPMYAINSSIMQSRWWLDTRWAPLIIHCLMYICWPLLFVSDGVSCIKLYLGKLVSYSIAWWCLCWNGSHGPTQYLGEMQTGWCPMYAINWNVMEPRWWWDTRWSLLIIHCLVYICWPLCVWWYYLVQIIPIAKLVFYSISWWCHDMEMISASLSLCEGNLPIAGGFPSQRANNAELWCFLCCLP